MEEGSKAPFKNRFEYRRAVRSRRADPITRSIKAAKAAQKAEAYISQKGKCAICDRWTFEKHFHWDHDHMTGAFRGLLCSMCNQGLGCFKDKESNLINAILYLRKSRKVEQPQPTF